MLHLVSGIYSPYLFVILIPPFPTHLFLHPSFHPLLIHHSAHPQLLLSFTPGGLKPTCFTNPTPSHVVSLPPGLPSLLFSVFPYFFVYVPCARLSWPSRQLFSTCKYTLSYRIAAISILVITPALGDAFSTADSTLNES